MFNILSADSWTQTDNKFQQFIVNLHHAFALTDFANPVITPSGLSQTHLINNVGNIFEGFMGLDNCRYLHRCKKSRSNACCFWSTFCELIQKANWIHISLVQTLEKFWIESEVVILRI